MDDSRQCLGDKSVALWCPTCKTQRPSYVKDSRANGKGGIRRRRVCGVCDSRFTTIEQTIKTHTPYTPYDYYTDDEWEHTG